MRRILKLLLGFLAINAIVWAVGQAIARSRTSSDLSSDEIELCTFWSGAEHVVRSPSLRYVKARILMGGATVDLRQSDPSPDGTTVDVGTMLGGAAVLVPRNWNVEVVEETQNAEVAVQLDEPTGEVAAAPKVTIRLATSYGGALVGHDLPRDTDS